MRVLEALPVDRSAQASLSTAWQRVVHDGAAALGRVSAVRDAVRASWTRALEHGVRPSLPRAPQCFDDDSLAARREALDWLPHAEQVVRTYASGSVLDGHILALFDDRARMLAAAGDPDALEGLADINFRPGALWSEDVVGTNGPGTALATGRAVHIVGAEHFCERWQQWHCAAAPVRDPLTRDIIGVLDLSGFRDRAHPHTLSLATAMAVALEQRLATREAERRVTLLKQFGALVGRYPTDVVLVVDRAGEIVTASATGDRLVRRLQASGREAVDALREIGAPERRPGTTWPAPAHSHVRDAAHPLLGGTATVHGMMDGGTAIGACIVLPVARHSSSSRTSVQTAAIERVHQHVVRYGPASLRGAAPVLEEVRRFASACARTDLPVLLLGESGTGKEVVAQGIHAASPRAHAPFVAVNCAALPRDLVESELFGHVAGAFSGARKEGAVGKFEAADGGTLFLDEIGELPPTAQAALLRALQEGEVTRLGATSGRRVDVRIIAATNRDIAEAIASGRLRDDLYHRLNVLAIALPPLRERPGDAVLLARHFLAECTGTVAQEFSAQVLSAFETYRWPGNVRELENLVKRLAALAESPVIDESLLPAALRDAKRTETPSTNAERRTEGVPPTARDALRGRYAALIAAHATMQEAAAAIGVTRSTLYRRLQRLGLAPGRGVRNSA